MGNETFYGDGHIETRVEVWENERCCRNTRRRFHQNVEQKRVAESFEQFLTDSNSEVTRKGLWLWWPIL